MYAYNIILLHTNVYLSLSLCVYDGTVKYISINMYTIIAHTSDGNDVISFLFCIVTTTFPDRFYSIEEMNTGQVRRYTFDKIKLKPNYDLSGFQDLIRNVLYFNR